MPHIPYVDPDNVADPEIKGYLERARREGTPRPESQAVRANVPNVIRAFSQAWDLTFRHGELVELGFFIGLTLGQQRWIKTLGIEHGAVLGDTTTGLAPAK